MATILIIDDSETSRGEIRAAIQSAKQFDTVLEASDGYAGLKMLLAECVDVVLCDLEMPGLDGEKLLRVKASSPGGANIPFLFLTASSDLDRKARLLDDGAADAIAKPFHPADLVARLNLHLKIKRLQDELLEKNAQLRRLSSVDSLTGLRTRRFVFDCLNIEFLRARRYKTPLALLMADLDHFKAINDEHGHLGGDAVLRQVSEILLSRLRATDVVGRYGGEEIIVLMPQNDLAGARSMADRWREEIGAHVFVLPDGAKARVTTSIGAACYEPGMEEPEDLIAAADSALYVAKQKGRNRVEIA